MKDKDVKKLIELREKIDSIDKEIVGLLQKRLEVAKKIGEEKRRFSPDALDVTREREVLHHILDINRGLFPEDGLKVIYSEIISACRNAQRPARIGYLGPETTFTHMAACKFFGHSPEFIPLRNITEVFEEVEGEAEEVIYGEPQELLEAYGFMPQPELSRPSQGIVTMRRGDTEIVLLQKEPEEGERLLKRILKKRIRAFVILISPGVKVARGVRSLIVPDGDMVTLERFVKDVLR